MKSSLWCFRCEHELLPHKRFPGSGLFLCHWVASPGALYRRFRFFSRRFYPGVPRSLGWKVSFFSSVPLCCCASVVPQGFRHVFCSAQGPRSDAARILHGPIGSRIFFPPRSFSSSCTQPLFCAPPPSSGPSFSSQGFCGMILDITFPPGSPRRACSVIYSHFRSDFPISGFFPFDPPVYLILSLRHAFAQLRLLFPVERENAFYP